MIDVVTAFLYGDLEEKIYMKVLEGFKECLKKEFKNNCAMMKKAGFCLVQATRQYYKKFVKLLTKEIEFDECLADQCLLKREDKARVVLICIYIDDTLCIGDREALEKFTGQIQDCRGRDIRQICLIQIEKSEQQRRHNEAIKSNQKDQEEF